MSFRLTYSTMFDPPPELHTRFDAAMARTLGALGAYHPLHIAGEDRRGTPMLPKRNPANHEQLLGEFAAGTSGDADEAVHAADRAWRGWKQTPWPRRVQLLRRVGQLLEDERDAFGLCMDGCRAVRVDRSSQVLPEERRRIDLREATHLHPVRVEAQRPAESRKGVPSVNSR